jgi:hypothetical protein
LENTLEPGLLADLLERTSPISIFRRLKEQFLEIAGAQAVERRQEK